MTKGRVLYFATFFLAVLALSWVFATWREMWATPVARTYGKFALAAGWFTALFTILGFFMYEKEKRKGKITRKVGLYEWLESKGLGVGI